MHYLLTLLALSSLLVSCGKNPNLNFVKTVELKTFQKDNQAYGQVRTNLDTGSIQLPGISLPITDPRNPIINYGNLGIVLNLNGTTDIVIDVNLSAVAQLPGGPATLPNGTALPVGGLNGVDVIELAVDRTGAKVYFAFGSNVVLAGTAIPIREFNGIGQYIGGANLFTAFQAGSSVRGIAGIFTGKNEGQNGIGFFVDASKLLQTSPPSQPNVHGNGLASVSSALTSHSSSRSFAVHFADIKPSSKNEQRIKESVYKLHRRAARVRLN
jgi:hypothetical protein